MAKAICANKHFVRLWTTAGEIAGLYCRGTSGILGAEKPWIAAGYSPGEKLKSTTSGERIFLILILYSNAGSVNLKLVYLPPS